MSSTTTTKTKTTPIESVAHEETPREPFGVAKGHVVVGRSGVPVHCGEALYLSREEALVLALRGAIDAPGLAPTPAERLQAARTLFAELEAGRESTGWSAAEYLRARRNKKLYEIVERELAALMRQEDEVEK